jgi:hypothetical protein
MPAELPTKPMTCWSLLQPRRDLRSGVGSFFIICFVILLIEACKKDAAPEDRNWGIYWAFTPQNELYGGIGSQGWADFFNYQAKYDAFVVLWSPAALPSDDILSWTSDAELNATATRFIRLWWISSNMDTNTIQANIHSFLFGVNVPSGADANVLGATGRRGQLLSPRSAAYSFVFKTRIFGRPYLTTDEQRWNYVNLVTLHELGHARGLNYNDEHTYHSGGNEANCIMNVFAYGVQAPTPFVLCGFHQRILRQCLKAAILSNYNRSDPCASAP